MVRLSFLLVAATCLTCEAKVKDEPGGAEMDLLRAADPKSYEQVRQLLNEQTLGLDHQHSRGHVNSAISEKFQLSSAQKDRRAVLDLEASMMADRKRWANAANSRSGQLAAKLIAKPKPQPTPPTKVEHHKRAHQDALLDAEVADSSNEEVVLAKRFKRSMVGEKVSWGEMRSESSALRKGKTFRSTASSSSNWKKLSWGDVLSNIHEAPKKAALKAAHGNKILGFDWGTVDPTGEQQADKKKSLALSTKRVEMIPHVDPEDMPDQLSKFLGMGHDEEAQPITHTERAKQDSVYLKDLGSFA